MSDTVTIKSCATQSEAELLKALLEQSGIHAHIMADDYVGLPLNTSGGVQLQVLEEDAAAAQDILQEAAKEKLSAEDFGEQDPAEDGSE